MLQGRVRALTHLITFFAFLLRCARMLSKLFEGVGQMRLLHFKQACSQRWRETSAEKRDLERLQHSMINEVRQAAEVHRQVGGLCMWQIQAGHDIFYFCRLSPF